MKAIFKLFSLAALASCLLTVSCSDDFLQKDSLTSVSAATFWKTPEDAFAGLVACYDALTSRYLYSGGPYECGMFYLDCMTDNGGHFNWNGWMPGYDICNGTATPSCSFSRLVWQAAYEAIKRCNALIANVDNIEGLDAGTAALYKAEAKYMRSDIYHFLAMGFHDVPYITAPQSISESAAEKTDRATIINGVISEFTEIIKDLPVNADSGRITKGAAMARLARVYLYEGQWDKAAELYNQVIALGKYELFNDYSTLFTPANEKCSEIILGIRFEGPGLSEGANWTGHWNTPLEAMNGTIDYADDFYKTDGTRYTDKYVCSHKDDGSPNLADVDYHRYDDRDPRLYATLWVPGMSWNGKSVQTGRMYGGAASAYSTVYVSKYFDGTDTKNSWDSPQDFYAIRYAEVLVSLAECYAETGKLNEAIALVDQIRARVNMPSVESVEGSGLSQDEVRQIVRHERRVELGFEGFRLFDLYRWRLLEDAKDRVNAEAEYYNFNYEFRYHRGEMDYVWPLPQHEIDSNKNLVQNDLWK